MVILIGLALIATCVSSQALYDWLNIVLIGIDHFCLYWPMFRYSYDLFDLMILFMIDNLLSSLNFL
jgi:hypothetical protein